MGERQRGETASEWRRRIYDEQHETSQRIKAIEAKVKARSFAASRWLISRLEYLGFNEDDSGLYLRWCAFEGTIKAFAAMLGRTTNGTGEKIRWIRRALGESRHRPAFPRPIRADLSEAEIEALTDWSEGGSGKPLPRGSQRRIKTLDARAERLKKELAKAEARLAEALKSKGLPE